MSDILDLSDKRPRTRGLGGQRQADVLAIVRRHPEGVSAADIARELHCTRENVLQALGVLLRQGQVTRPALTAWRLLWTAVRNMEGRPCSF